MVREVGGFIGFICQKGGGGGHEFFPEKEVLLVSFHVLKGACLSLLFALLGSTTETRITITKKREREAVSEPGELYEFWIEVDTQHIPRRYAVAIMKFLLEDHHCSRRV